ncbi:MAG: hypothetical protein ACKV2V_06705 [Blastocatellia bacterium]
MQIRKTIAQHLLTLAALVCLASMALAQANSGIGPGLAYPPASEASDQKAGSVLIYNFYSSDAGAPATDTRFSITNVNARQGVWAHLFFVDGANCTAQDVYQYLSPNKTTVFSASYYDPLTTGFLVVVATNPDNGCPISHNFLIGSAFVNFRNGADVYRANLPAVAVAALADTGKEIECDEVNYIATLRFNGTAGNYNRLARVVAVDNFGSAAAPDNNRGLVVLNRIAGSLATGVTAVGTLFGVMYDDDETPYSFSFTSGSCQFRNVIGNNFPIIAPPTNTIVPAGHSGWMKFYSLTADNAYTGSYINIDGVNGNGGHNLSHLTLSAAGSFVVPLVPYN